MVSFISVFISLIPLVTWNSHFEVPKVFVFLILGLVVLFYLIFILPQLSITKSDRYFLIWLALLLISAFSSNDVKTAILGGSYRHQGVIFFFALFLVFKFVESLNSKTRRLLNQSIAVVTLIEAGLVLAGFKLGTIGNINAVSGFLAMGGYYVYKTFPKVIILFPILAMVIDFSKTAFISLAAFVIGKRNILLVIPLVLVLFLFKPINNSSPFENREVIWKYSLNIIQNKPILGYGNESNEILFKNEFYKSGIPLSGLIIDRAHNLFLDVTIWSGLVGLLFFVLFLIEIYKKGDSEKRILLLSFLIYSMFQPLSVVHWLMLALIV